MKSDICRILTTKISNGAYYEIKYIDIYKIYRYNFFKFNSIFVDIKNKIKIGLE